MTSKHTPGPWRVEDPAKAEHSWVIVHGDGDSVASCEPVGPWMPDDEATANARLIAAAPDLLRALEEIKVLGDAHIPTMETCTVGIRMHGIADAAISRAKGESDDSR